MSLALYNKEWYAISTIPGREVKVKDNILRSIRAVGMDDRVFNVEVPEVKEVKYVKGKRESRVVKLYPGYIFVEMIMDDESWQFVRRTQGVTAIIGCGSKPVPLTQNEIEKILGADGKNRNMSINIEVGEQVAIKEGPFTGVYGEVKDVSSNGKIQVAVEFFGRESTVTLGYDQLERVLSGGDI